MSISETEKRLREECAQHPFCTKAAGALAAWLRSKKRFQEARTCRRIVKRLQERRNAMVLVNQGLIGKQIERMAHLPSLALRGGKECYSDGQIGLIRACELWDPERGIQFSTYASLAIRNEILHGMEQDGLPVTSSGRVLERESLQEHEPSTTDTPELEEADTKARILGIIAELPEKEREVIALLYYQDANGEEAGERLGITRQAVQARHTKALAEIRKQLRWCPVREVA
jgi:RNA polymerase sigma factor (sigma-70 family)